MLTFMLRSRTINVINTHRIMHHIPLVILLASLLHIGEEFIYPGDFGPRFKSMMAGIGIRISNTWLILTNVVFLLAVTSILFTDRLFYHQSIVSILITNALLHIGKSIHSKSYFPGLVTAVLLYIPIGLVSFVTVELSPGFKALSFTTGVLLHGVPFIGLFILRRAKQ